MRALVGVGDPARHLARVHGCIAHEAEHGHGAFVHAAGHAVAGLLGAFGEVDAAPVQPGRRTGFQTTLGQLQLLQTRRQRHRRWVPRPAGRVVVQAHMDLAVQESARRQHHRAAAKADTHLRHSPHHAVALHHQVVHGLLEQPQIRLVLQHAADGGLVQDAVSLRPRGAHGGALAAVENAELDAALVRGQRHGATQRIHLFHQVALADAANAGVAAHLPQRLDVVREQQRSLPQARGSQRGLGARMATADNDHIKFLGIQHGTTPGPTGPHPNTSHKPSTGALVPAQRRPCGPCSGKPPIFPPLAGARPRALPPAIASSVRPVLGWTVSRETSAFDRALHSPARGLHPQEPCTGPVLQPKNSS